MQSFLKTGPEFIQYPQQCINSWVPTVPRDALWGCAKSAMGSFIITAFCTEWKITPAAKAAAAAIIASAAHTVAISLIRVFDNRNNIIPAPERKWTHMEHGASLLVLFTLYLFGRKEGMASLTILLTTFAYLPTQNYNRGVSSTPLFLISVIR